MNKKELNEIKENYFPANLSLESLFSMIEEQEGNLNKLRLLFEGQEQQVLTVSAIPDIPISEIGWSDISTPEGSKEFSATARGQLMNFLSNIQGDDLSDKLESLNDFYDMDESLMGKLGLGKKTPAEQISSVLSYLVFYKTLTTILTNFNASSAGFSFESFLAVLLKGKQIPPGQNTIADLTNPSGPPISLKLYKEGSVEVGGSFKDLAKDLMKGPMQYIVCMKDIEALDPANPLERNGKIVWYRFDFTLDNVFAILAKSSAGKESSRKSIILPTRFMESVTQAGRSSKKLANVAIELPAGGEYPSAEEVESEFIAIATKMIQEADLSYLGTIKLDKLFGTIKYAKNDRIFSKGEVVRGSSELRKNDLKAVIKDLFPDANFKTLAPLTNLLDLANKRLIEKYSHSTAMKNRKAAINNEFWVGREKQGDLVERSLEVYEGLSKQQKILALQNCLGFVNNRHFSMTGGMAKNIVAMSAPHRTLPAGQSGAEIGTTHVGPDAIQKMLNQVIGLINQNVFAIFNNLKTLTTSIHTYFAGGLQADDEAVTAIHAADNIETKTTEIASPTVRQKVGGKA